MGSRHQAGHLLQFQDSKDSEQPGAHLSAPIQSLAPRTQAGDEEAAVCYHTPKDTWSHRNTPAWLGGWTPMASLWQAMKKIFPKEGCGGKSGDNALLTLFPVRSERGSLWVRGNVLLSLPFSATFLQVCVPFQCVIQFKSCEKTQRGKNNWKINSVSNSPHIVWAHECESIQKY